MRSLSPEDFEPADAPLALRVGETQVWFFTNWPDTKNVAESIFVREWLGKYLGQSEVRIERDERGKPFIADASLRFNLSHSAGALVLAVNASNEVGVDLEDARRQRRAMELAQRWFDPSELQALGNLPESARQTAFLRLWSCKEAVLKADGSGIANGLHRAVFRLDASGAVCGFGATNQFNDVEFLPLMPAVGFVGALAWRGKGGPVAAFRYTGRVDSGH